MSARINDAVSRIRAHWFVRDRSASSMGRMPSTPLGTPVLGSSRADNPPGSAYTAHMSSHVKAGLHSWSSTSAAVALSSFCRTSHWGEDGCALARSPFASNDAFSSSSHRRHSGGSRRRSCRSQNSPSSSTGTGRNKPLSAMSPVVKKPYTRPCTSPLSGQSMASDNAAIKAMLYFMGTALTATGRSASRRLLSGWRRTATD
mmetsp:Transcript_36878/g.92652  ORF Transcript_36878/g.92652 Transcript_36878/m.92652 type:complete len:202 (-) Transcript_36878:16-621(-)